MTARLCLLLGSCVVLDRCSHGCAFWLSFRHLACSTGASLRVHLLFDSLDVSVGIVGFGQVLFLESLQLVPPNFEDVTFDADVVARLRVAPERLIVSTKERAQASSEHTFDYHWYRDVRLLPLLCALVESELATVICTPHEAVSFNRKRTGVP